MCDYSLQSVRSRPAKVGDKLTTRDFGTGTRGFAAAEDNAVAVCVLPGTELAFSSAVTVTEPRFVVGWKAETLGDATAIFRQVNKNEQRTHHDALEAAWMHSETAGLVRYCYAKIAKAFPGKYEVCR
jgi:hypothetical protein